jgi:hypothetical protein
MILPAVAENGGTFSAYAKCGNEEFSLSYDKPSLNQATKRIKSAIKTAER